jgi:hypothetical protein
MNTESVLYVLRKLLYKRLFLDKYGSRIQYSESVLYVLRELLYKDSSWKNIYLLHQSNHRVHTKYYRLSYRTVLPATAVMGTEFSSSFRIEFRENRCKMWFVISHTRPPFHEILLWGEANSFACFVIFRRNETLSFAILPIKHINSISKVL